MPKNKIKVSIKAADHKKSDLLDIVGLIIKKKNAIMRLAHEKNTPFYVLKYFLYDHRIDRAYSHLER